MGPCPCPGTCGEQETATLTSIWPSPPAAHGPGVDEALDRVNLDSQRLAAESHGVELAVGDISADRSCSSTARRLGRVVQRDEPGG